MNQLVKVPFYGDVLEATKGTDGKVLVSIRRVCESLGVDHASQWRKLTDADRAPWACVVMMTTHDSGGREQEMSMIDLDGLPMWLATIEVNRVSEGVRGKLVAYQKEAARVLRDHFLGKPEKSAQPEFFSGMGTKALLAAVQQMCEIEEAWRQTATRVTVVEETVNQIVQVQEEASAAMAILDKPEQSAPQKTDRARINECVRAFCHFKKVPHKDAWNKLYREVNYRLHFDAKARAKNRDSSPLDEIEAAGKLGEAYAISVEIFA